MNVHASALAKTHRFDEATSAFASDVIDGLAQQPKRLSPKYFYDAAGSELFEQITLLPEYYPTRTELAILHADAAAMADRLGPDCLVIEYGSGSGTKTRLLLDALSRPAGYLPVDIARDHLERSAAALAADFPGLTVMPVCADFTRPFALPPNAPTTCLTVMALPRKTSRCSVPWK